MRSTRRHFLLAAAGVACASRAQVQGTVRDTQVKAAYLLKFATFVEWPEGSFAAADARLVIGVVGDDTLVRDLRELARTIDGRPVAITRIVPGEPVGGVHILYVKAATPARVTELIGGVGPGVLTVGDSDGAHPRGCVLSFYLEDGKVRFAASVQAAAQQRLRLSSRLLSVARSVQG